MRKPNPQDLILIESDNFQNVHYVSEVERKFSRCVLYNIDNNIKHFMNQDRQTFYYTAGEDYQIIDGIKRIGDINTEINPDLARVLIKTIHKIQTYKHECLVDKYYISIDGKPITPKVLEEPIVSLLLDNDDVKCDTMGWMMLLDEKIRSKSDTCLEDYITEILITDSYINEFLFNTDMDNRYIQIIRRLKYILKYNKTPEIFLTEKGFETSLFLNEFLVASIA